MSAATLGHDKLRQRGGATEYFADAGFSTRCEPLHFPRAVTVLSIERCELIGWACLTSPERDLALTRWIFRERFDLRAVRSWSDESLWP